MTDACYKAGQSGEVAAEFSAVMQQIALSNSHDLRAANDPASPTLARFYKAVGSVLQNGSKLDGASGHANIISKIVGVQQQLDVNKQTRIQRQISSAVQEEEIGVDHPTVTGI